MKNSIYLFVLLIAIISCKGNDDSPTPIASGIEKTWGLGSDGYVTVDGLDMTSDYAGFTIEFQELESGNVLYVTNGSHAFPFAVDTWHYTNAEQNVIERDSDGLQIRFTLNDNSIILNFAINTPTGGRLEGTVGEFEFKLSAIN